MEACISGEQRWAIMTDERLTDELARALGWRKAPGRYLKSGRSWIPESRFRPLLDLRDAFRVLDTASGDYSLLAKPGGVFTAQVRLAGRTGKATGEPKARAISLAVARALGLETDA
jgi:hypothetical protein